MNNLYFIMAGNTGKGYRQGAVKHSKQCFNERTGKFVKIDTKTGKFTKCSDNKFKGVTKTITATQKVNSKSNKNFKFNNIGIKYSK